MLSEHPHYRQFRRGSFPNHGFQSRTFIRVAMRHVCVKNGRCGNRVSAPRNLRRARSVKPRRNIISAYIEGFSAARAQEGKSIWRIGFDAVKF